MTTDEGPFSAWSREHSPLSQALADRSGAAGRFCEHLRPETLVSSPAEALVDDVLGRVMLLRGDHDKGYVIGCPEIRAERIPLAVGPGRASELRGENFESNIPCWVWELAFRWFCPKDLLWKWPNETGDHLRVYDNHPQLGTPPAIKWTDSEEKLVALCYTPRSLNGEASALDLEQATRPEGLFTEAAEQVKSYTEAFNKQITAWRASLRARLVELVRRRQEVIRLSDSDRIRIEELLGAWRVGPLEVDVSVSTEPPTSLPTVLGSALPPPVALPPPLTDASFDDIIRVVNNWVCAVEKYAVAYLNMEEERLVDQLTACLNGAFSRANREVLFGKGRTDFYVEPKVLGIDGTAQVFTGEAKVWAGGQSLSRAVGQALSNLTQSARTVLLVVFVKDRASFGKACRNGERILSQDPRTKSKRPTRAERPCFEMVSALDPEETVELCAVFVDLTRERSLVGKPKGRRPASPGQLSREQVLEASGLRGCVRQHRSDRTNGAEA